MRPLVLPPNQPQQFYRGGSSIAEFRGGAAALDFGPEDWVASTVTLFGGDTGLSSLPNGTLLRDAIAEHPVEFLGRSHLDAFGTDPALLVKLLDAGERLPVHVHPDQQFAARHLGSPHGKTEAWVVIGTSSPDPAVYLGFTEDVPSSDVGEWVAAQRCDVLLEALNRLPVSAGDTVLVPAGTPHAIDAGVFVVELQEPTDFSVMLEWKGFRLAERADEQLGLPASVALSCLDTTGWDTDRLASCVTRKALSDAVGVRSVLPPSADSFFRAEQIVTDTEFSLGAQFAVVVVLDGRAQLIGDFDEPVSVQRGDTVLVPHAAGDVRVVGTVNLLRCLPPVLSETGDAHA